MVAVYRFLSSAVTSTTRVDTDTYGGVPVDDG